MAKKPTYWDKRALNRLSESEKMSEEYIKRIKKIYEKSFKDIEKDIQKVYRNYSKETGVDVQKLKELLTKKETDKVWKTLKRQGLDKYIKNNYKARISRLEQIQAQIYAKAKQIYPKEELEHTMAYKGVVNQSYYKAVYDTQMGTGYNFTFSKIDKNLMDAVLSERWSGKNYSERIWGNTDILADSLSDVISSGLMNGQSIQKMTKQIKDRFKVSQYYAERLVRTETNHFNNMADAMAYEEMGVEYYVFVATLDSRTSEICQTMDGKKFAYKDKEEGVNYPPLHPNCRSKTRGYVDEETEKSLQRRARNPITGKTEIINNMSYKDWAKNTMGIEKNGNKRYNKGKLTGTGKKYTPKYKKIKGKHSIEDDVRATNPNYNRVTPEWYKNCQRCVPTYDMRRRGYDVEAKPKYLTDEISIRPQVVYKDPVIKHFTQKPKESIIKEMDNWGDGARCQICVYWSGGGGHTFVAEKRKGKVIFVDPQVNDTNVAKYFDNIRVKDSYFYRIDNLDVTDYIKDCCKGVDK